MAIKEVEGFGFQDAKDIPRGKKRGYLLIGDSGSGKTHLCGEFREEGSVFITDWDNGIETLRGLDGIKYHTILEDTKRPHAFRDFLTKVKPVITQMVEDGEIQTYVDDSLTTMGEMALNKVLLDNGSLGGQPSWPEWDGQVKLIKQQIEWGFLLVSKGCNYIMTAHEEAIEDKTTGKVKYLPLTTGKFRQRILIFFQEIYNLKVDSTEKGSTFSFGTRADRQHAAKTKLDYETPYVTSSYASIKKAIES